MRLVPTINKRLKKVSAVISHLPGERILGYYRYLPIFVLAGAALEFTMIKWTVGETNLYTYHKKKQAKLIAESRLNKERTLNAALPTIQAPRLIS